MPEYAFTEKDRRRWAQAAAGAVAAAASRVRDRMATRLDGRSTLPSSPGAVFDQEEWADEIAGEIDEAFRSVANEAAGAFADGVGARSRFSEAAMQVMVGLVAAEVAGQLASRGEVVEARIETLLERGGEAGWDPAKLADELGLGEAASGPLSDALAEAMGTSAATSIAEGAAHGVIDLAGLTGYKTWHCMFRNSRDSHMDADLQTVPVDEPFILENGEGMYPGDPDLPPEEAINCQCWVTYSVELPGGEVLEGEATAEEIGEALAAHAGPGPLVVRGPGCAVHGVRSTSPVAPRRTLDAVTTAPFAIAPDSPAGQWVARSAAYSADLSGVIVSVEPTPLQKAALALPDGEPAERLHVTLCYLGSADALDDEARRIIASVCASFGPQRGPIEGSVGGIGWFGSADAMTLGLIDAPGLSSLRSTVCSALADAGYPVVDDHDFTPHITLAYGQADAAAKVGMPLTFNELRLRWGTEVLAFDLIGPGAPPEAPAPMPEAPPAPPEEVPAVAENTAPAAPAAAAAGTRAAFGDEAPVDAPPTDIASIPDDALALELARRLAGEAVRHVEDAGGTVPPAAHAMLEQEALHELGEALSDVVKDLVEDTAEAEAEEPEVPAEAEPAVPVSAAAIRARLRARAAQLAEEPMVGPDGQPVTPPAAVAPVVCPECGMEVVPTAEGLCPECGAFCSDGQVRLGVEEAAADTDFEWEGVLTVEGVLSGDNRMIAEGCLTWRDLPIPLMLQTVNAPGHDGSVFCGWIHDVERVGANIIGRGTFTDDEAGAQARGILADPAGAKRFGVSVDIDSVQMVFADPSGAELSPDEAMEAHLFGGSADVVELLVAGRVMGACYDEETEILTENHGWLPFAEVPVGERVATMHPKTGAFEWQEPTGYTNDSWSGPMVRFTSGGVQGPEGSPAKFHRSLDLLVTPNHRMLVESTKTGKRLFMRADELAEKSNRSYRIPLVSEWDAPDVDTVRIDGTLWGSDAPWEMDGDNFAALLGAYLSEGCAYRGDHSRIKGVYIAQQPTSKGRALFAALADRIGMSVSEGGFTLHDSRFGRWAAQFGTATEKFIPEEIKNLSARQLAIFLRHFIAGDGDLEGRRIYTSSLRLAGDLQEVAQKCGMWAVVNERPAHENSIDGRPIVASGPSYVVALRNRPGSRPAAACWDWKAEHVDHHEGTVRCVTVPNESLYVRRNGVPVWCGNTLTPFPAFQEAHVYLLGPNESAAPALVASASGPIWSATRPLTGFTLDGAEPTAALVASAAVTVDEEAPPAAWFQLEPMDEPIAFSVHPDGRCYGLVAQWGTCHIGDTARCVGVPRSNDFRSFYTGKQIVTREGTVLAVGPVIMDTVHPDLFMQASDAQAFYAHTGCAVADVRLYTNEHGIVAAGAVRPGIDRLTLRRFMASDISPDWRPISGEHRLVSLLAVNTSGFLVEGIAASAGRFQPWGIVDLSTGEVGALVAAGAVRRRPSVNEELAGLRAELADQRAVLAEQASLIEKLLAPHVAADRRARAAAALDALGLDCGCDEAADGERAARAAAALDKLGL